MAQSNLILEFIDGTLDENREQMLFNEMAKHAELRSELQQYVMIGDAVRSDREAFTPPAATERSLLGSLGLLATNSGASRAGGALLGGAGASLLSLAGLKQVLPLLVSFLLGGVLIGGGVWFGMGHEDSGEDINVVMERGIGTSLSTDKVVEGTQANEYLNDELNASSALQDVSPSVVDDANSFATHRLTERSSTVERSKTISRSREERYQRSDDHASARGNGGSGSVATSANDGRSSSNSAVSTDRKNDGLNEDASDVDNNVARASYSDLRLPTANYAEEVLASSSDQREDVVLSPELAAKVPIYGLENTAEDQSRKALAFEFRKNVTSQPFNDNRAQTIQTQFINQFFNEEWAAAVYYSASDYWRVGIEAGKERFAQTLFYNQNDTIAIHQKPNITWMGATFQRDMSDIVSLPLFAQGSLGASEHGGPLLRGRLGLDLMELMTSSSMNVAIPASVDVASLVYQYQGQYLFTGRWGLSVGLQYKLGL